LTSIQRLAALLQDKGWLLATAESCTGGLIAAACTDLPGSSNWFDRGFVTYSDASKIELLGVEPAVIAAHGAVSEQVVRGMASGAVRRSRAHVSVAVTGIAGPSGGSSQKPVGTVWFGFAVGAALTSEMKRFEGNRGEVRRMTVEHALSRLAELLGQPDQG
jgi:nicotinamide-nucleotide amidase